MQVRLTERDRLQGREREREREREIEKEGGKCQDIGIP
jgi:hypothetical protein